MQIKLKIKKIKNQRGTTIIELLIYLALLAIFLTILLDVFVTTLDFKLSSESTSTLNQDTRYIFGRIGYDVYNADSFTVPSSSELDVVRGGVVTKYTLSSGDLLRGADKLNSLDTKVQSLSFLAIGRTVRISLTMISQFILPGGAHTQSVDTTFAPR